LSVFAGEMPKRISGHNNGEGTVEWREQRKNKFIICTLDVILCRVSQKRIKLARYIARMKETHIKFWSERRKKTGGILLYVSIKLKHMLENKV